MKVKEILKAKGADVITVEPHTPVATVVYLLKQKSVGAVVVSDNGHRVLGVVNERDIVLGLATHGERLLQLSTEQILAHEATTCQPDDDVRDLMIKMTNRRVRHLPVIENGLLCGIVSIGDVVKSRLRLLELETGVLRDAYIAHTRSP